MARRMASGRADVNDILASFLPVRDIGEGQPVGARLSTRDPSTSVRIRTIPAPRKSNTVLLAGRPLRTLQPSKLNPGHEWSIQ